MANVIEILVTGRNLTKPAFDEAARNGRAIGQHTGDEFAKGVGDQVKKDLPAEVEKPLEDSGRKGGTKAGQAASKGLSPLLIGAFTAAATVGPAALLAGAATAVIGVGALVTKGNLQLSASYAKLGGDASAAIQKAAAPLVPELYSAVQVLDKGVVAIGPELKSVFAAVAPDVTAITGGFVSLVGNTLPGLASGLRAIAPFASELGADFGKIGSGLGGLFQQLGTGASGGMAGFTALATIVERLLPDIGKIVADLSNGLGPALGDVEHVAVPVADALTAVVHAFPPDLIRAAADAALALFLAFKVGTIAGVVAEGTTFLGFLGMATTAEGAMTLATGAATAATTALGTAMDAALGPIGILAVGYTAVKSAMDATSNSGDGVGGMLRRMREPTAAAKQATQDLADATAQANNGLVTEQIQLAQTAGKAGQAAVAALSFASAQGGLNTALSTAISDYDLAKGAASGYKTALDALYGKYQSYSDAQATFTTDLDAAAKGLKASKDGFDTNTTAGAANYQLMSTLATANADRAEALLKETNSQDQANQSLRAGAVQIDNMARSAHFTQKQIDALNIALYGTKNIGSITVPINANVSPALSQLNGLIEKINSSSGTVQIYGTGGGSYGGGRALGGQAHGGIVGAVGMAAVGGPRSNLTWVGEHGAELLDLPPGARVHSNPDSMRMAAQGAAGAGGWDGVVRLEVTGDDLMAQWIRNHVRVVAGNAPNSVQRAFGQTF